MSRRIDDAAAFSEKVRKHKERCSEARCVNWDCDGKTHFSMAGNRWGMGWPHISDLTVEIDPEGNFWTTLCRDCAATESTSSRREARNEARSHRKRFSDG